MTMIDFHAHILPGADHGSDSIDTSQRQLSLIVEAGVSAVVATPHFYPHQERPAQFLERRGYCMQRMQQTMPENSPTVYVGAEVLLCPGIHEMEGLAELAICGTKVLLLEMPTTTWGISLLDTVEEIRDAGFHPVMAHIDRYPTSEVQKLLTRGFSVQLNATAFLGLSGGKKFLPYLADGTVVALGSDLHGSDPADYKPFLKMRKRLTVQTDAVFTRTATLLQGAIPLRQLTEKV